jgi:hypothetical protein
MVAWGTGSFENDDAADWLAKVGTIAPDGSDTDIRSGR